MTKGFTLIELVLVIAVIFIVAIIALPRIVSINDFRQAAATDKVRQDLSYARDYAVNNNCRSRVLYNTANDSYTVTSDLSGSWQDIADPATHTSPFTVTLNQGAFIDVEITGVNFDGQVTVEFDSLGRPYSYDGSSSTLLSSDGSVTLTGSDTVTVTRDMGRIN